MKELKHMWDCQVLLGNFREFYEKYPTHPSKHIYDETMVKIDKIFGE